jgi:hypothetical protein
MKDYGVVVGSGETAKTACELVSTKCAAIKKDGAAWWSGGPAHVFGGNFDFVNESRDRIESILPDRLESLAQAFEARYAMQKAKGGRRWELSIFEWERGGAVLIYFIGDTARASAESPSAVLIRNEDGTFYLGARG